MELEALEGSIIGVISDDYETFNYDGKKVSEIILKKAEDALKMVELDKDLLDKFYDDLSTREKSKVIIASKLQDKIIILNNITKGLIKKDIEFLKRLFKRVEKYNRKIILIDKNAELFLNLVDNIYVINNKNVVYKTNNIFDNELGNYIDLPKIVSFTNKLKSKGIRINEYNELDDLLKAIYRIKS